MPGKRTSVYMSDRMSNLLAAHGPAPTRTERNLAAKLDYITRAYDAILRDAKRRWDLTDREWDVLFGCCKDHKFAMDIGGDALDDVGACLARVEALPDDLDSLTRSALLGKLKSATAAQSLALVWMVIRERKRIGEDLNAKTKKEGNP